MKNKSYKFLSFSLTLLFMFVSTGCGSDKKETPVQTGAAAFVPSTYPRFDPVISDLPFNTDLVFAKAAATDGTADVGAPTNTVVATLNGLDGFSTSAYFDVMIAGSVDPTSVTALKSVFLVEVNSGGKEALDPANIVGLIGPASFDAVVVSLDGGTNNAIRIRPLLPLKAKAKYLVFLTNDIKDMSGKPLSRSWTYNALRDTSYSVFESLVPVRTAIVGWETLASGFLAAVNTTLNAATAKEKIVLSYTFTTSDPQAPLLAMASPRAAAASIKIGEGKTPTEAVTFALGLEGRDLLATPKVRPLKVSSVTGVDIGVLSNGQLAGNVGKLYTGFIKLPYYLTAQTPEKLRLADYSYLNRSWTPDLTLAAALNKVLPKDAKLSPNDPDVYNLTYRYPFAAKTGDESVPLQVTLPEKTWVPGTAGSSNCNQIYAASGYPVVIYVHGISSDRTSVLSLAHSLAKACVATVAIDLPLHGVAANSAFVTLLNVEKAQQFASLYGVDTPRERHFNVAGVGGAPAEMKFAASGANDGSGAQFINLISLFNTRDNMRQAVMDLLNLNASLKAINSDFVQGLGAGLDLNNVNLVGISLGGIIGSVFVAANQTAIDNEKTLNLPINLNPIRTMVASVTGTQVAQILINSQSFAPTINAGLAAKDVKVGTSNYEKFMYVAQSALDSGDPVSFAQSLSKLKIPVSVLVQQVNGDTVIPNSAASAPLAGTQALIRLLGATQITSAPSQTQLGLGFVKLNAANHTSLLRPSSAAPQITAEMQEQVVTFVTGAGKVTVGAVAPANIDIK